MSSRIWLYLSFFCCFLRSKAQDFDCSNAPPAVRNICNQIANWDKNTRSLPTGGATASISGPIAPQAVAPTEFDCTTISCLCGIYGGSGGENCVLPNGQSYTKVQRKEFRLMSDNERSRYVSAMWAILGNGGYRNLSVIHSSFQLSPGAHSGPAFMPWHREFLKRLEINLRKVDPTVSIPYWDSTMDGRIPDPKSSCLWHSDLLGFESSDGQVRNGVFANWPYIDNSRAFIRRRETVGGAMFSPSDIASVMSQTDVSQVLGNTAPRSDCPNPASWSAFEYAHGNPHIWVGGDMQVIITSTNDPVFFSHHSMVDLVWELWRQSQQSRAARATAYPQDDIRCHSQAHFAYNTMQPFTPFRNIDGLSNDYTDSLYSYAPRPTCSAQNINGCGSRFLFCDLSHGTPGCAAKIVLGGDCSSFIYNEDRCYLGTCLNNICVSSTTQPPATTSPPSTSCYNENVCCQTWAGRGECTRNPGWMNQNCVAACGICTPNYDPSVGWTPSNSKQQRLSECNNRHPSCPAWAARGECSNNRNWMAENCRQACNLCGQTRAQICGGGTTTTTMAPTQSSCLNQNYCCPIYAQAYCNSPQFANYMRQNCGPSCGFCQGPSNWNGPQCVDLSPNCNFWSNAGYCNSYSTYMWENCKASCGMCSLLNMTTRQRYCAAGSSREGKKTKHFGRKGQKTKTSGMARFI